MKNKEEKSGLATEIKIENKNGSYKCCVFGENGEAKESKEISDFRN